MKKINNQQNKIILNTINSENTLHVTKKTISKKKLKKSKQCKKCEKIYKKCNFFFEII